MSTWDQCLERLADDCTGQATWSVYTFDPRVAGEDSGQGPVWSAMCEPCKDDCQRVVAMVERAGVSER